MAAAVPPELDRSAATGGRSGYFADVRDGLEATPREFARIHGISSSPVPVGFMSWYSEKYGGALNEKAVMRTGRVRRRRRSRITAIGFVQIDDLWQNGPEAQRPGQGLHQGRPRTARTRAG